jgi:histidine triad (HIT) family protein
LTAYDATCVFCRIAAGELPARIVYDDSLVLAFLDAAPATPGHTLVVPRAHRRDLFDIADDELAQVVLAARRIAVAIREALGVPGVKLHQVSGADAGQDVFHFHLHVIPRTRGDGVQPAWGSPPWRAPDLDDARRDEIAAGIRARIEA